MLSGRGLCDELITRREESYRLCFVVVFDLETSRMGAPYIYDISHLRVNINPPLGEGGICQHSMLGVKEVSDKQRTSRKREMRTPRLS